MAEYRYLLTRTVDPLLASTGPTLLFVMLNPSTADERVDDPTIRRCAGFARREKASLFQVINLFALRSTDPVGLLLDRNNIPVADPVGERNDEMTLRSLRQSAQRVVCAWGANDFEITKARVRRFAELHAEAGSPPLWCLGMSQKGAPRHPLFVKADQPLVPFEVTRG